MTMPLGVSFAPGAPSMDYGQAQQPIQEAIKLLSLRLPRVVGANSPIPAPLLTAPGGMGMPDPTGNPLLDLLRRMLVPTAGSQPMPGPTGGGVPNPGMPGPLPLPTPMPGGSAPLPRIIPIDPGGEKPPVPEPTGGRTRPPGSPPIGTAVPRRR